MAERAWTACRCRPNGSPGLLSTSRSTTSPSRRRNAAARLRSRAPRGTPREHGQGAVPVALVAAQARFGEVPGCAAASRTRSAAGGRPRRCTIGRKNRVTSRRYAQGARFRVQGFLAPWSGREAAPVRAQKTLPRSAFQRDGRARHVHRRLFQAGPDSGGDAEVAEASEPAALPGGGGGKGQGDRRRSRRSGRCGRGKHAGDGGAAASGCVGRRARGARARVSARPGCDASDKARLIRFMALDDKTLKLCNCNRTMALDPKALAGALKLTQPIEIHTELCRKQVASFHGALKDEACVIACTQEAPLFSELADRAGSSSDIQFVNIREHAGWSKEGAKATPKIAALLALADLPEAEPVAGVSYKSGERKQRRDLGSRFRAFLRPPRVLTN